MERKYTEKFELKVLKWVTYSFYTLELKMCYGETFLVKASEQYRSLRLRYKSMQFRDRTDRVIIEVDK